jgi:hypothetical protein
MIPRRSFAQESCNHQTECEAAPWSAPSSCGRYAQLTSETNGCKSKLVCNLVLERFVGFDIRQLGDDSECLALLVFALIVQPLDGMLRGKRSTISLRFFILISREVLVSIND